MEQEVELEGIVIPDSYQSEEEREEHLKSKGPPSSFHSLMRRNNMISDDEEETEEADLEDKNIVNDHDEEEAKEVDLEDKNIVNDDEEEEEFYMVWFDAFLAKHEFDKDYMDQPSALQEILKTWLQKKVCSAKFRFKEAETDLRFINFRYVLCKQWLSSL